MRQNFIFYRSKKNCPSYVLIDLKALIAPKRTLASLIDAFNNCEQRANETVALFASRIRSCGVAAYSGMQDDIEPYLVAQFLKGLKATSILKSIIRAQRPDTLHAAMELASSLITSSPQNEIFVEEVQRKPQKVSFRNVDYARCTICNKSGHSANYCRVGNAEKCQLCSRSNHTAKDCWSRYQPNRISDGPCQICNSPSHVATQCRSVKISPKRMSDNPGFARTYATTDRNAKTYSQNDVRRKNNMPFNNSKQTFMSRQHSATTQSARNNRKN